MKKIQIFDELMEGFTEAIKYRKGLPNARVRVSRLASAPKQLRPYEIRKIRMNLGITQLVFAEYLGTSVDAVRSWEQGARRPGSTALRLLTIAKQTPAVLLQRT
jgi:putative transcriptional regulator